MGGQHPDRLAIRTPHRGREVEETQGLPRGRALQELRRMHVAHEGLLAAGADLAGLPNQRRSARIVALGGITGSLYFLVNDLGRPERFHHMLRVLKLTSPMSVGTWILSAYGPFAGLALGEEIVPVLPEKLARRLPTGLIARASRPAGIVAALVAPAVASYTAVLPNDTSLPSWSAARGTAATFWTARSRQPGRGRAWERSAWRWKRSSAATGPR